MIYIQDRTGPGLEIWKIFRLRPDRKNSAHGPYGTQNLGQDRTMAFVRLTRQKPEIVCQQRDEFNLSIKSYEVQK